MGPVPLITPPGLCLALPLFLLFSIPSPLRRVLERWEVGSRGRREILWHTDDDSLNRSPFNPDEEANPILAEYQRIFTLGPGRDSPDLPPVRLEADSGPIPAQTIHEIPEDDFLRSSSSGATARHPDTSSAAPESPASGGLGDAEREEDDQLFPQYPVADDGHEGSDRQDSSEVETTEAVAGTTREERTIDATEVHESLTPPVEALADAIVTGRERIESISTAIGDDSANLGVANIAIGVIAIRSEIRINLHRIERQLPSGEPSMHEAIAEIKERQERIEAGIRGHYGERSLRLHSKRGK